MPLGRSSAQKWVKDASFVVLYLPRTANFNRWVASFFEPIFRQKKNTPISRVAG